MAGGTKLTPMLAQYLRLKEQHRDAILMFRLGDFYEMFFDDAKRASAILDITLTARNRSDPSPIPLCGVPFHSVAPYIQKLLGAGLKVAICEQMQDPREAKGLVEREVVRVITPGTILEGENLDPRTASFLGVLAEADASYALALADLSTGELRVAEFPERGGAARETLDAVVEEIRRLGVKELVTTAAVQAALAAPGRLDGVFRSLIPAEWLVARAAPDDDAEAGAGSCGRAALTGLRRYLCETYRGKLDHLRAPEIYRPRDTLLLDEVSRDNLNLLQGGGGHAHGSLLALLDRTVTPMGSRSLRRWLVAPLTSCAAIERRLDAVAELVATPDRRADLRAALATMGDIERLGARVGAGRVAPRDLARLGAALESIETVRRLLAGCDGILGEAQAVLDPLPAMQARVRAMLVEAPPAALRSTAVVRDGCHPEVDELRALVRDGRGWVAALEASERRRTGIQSLKIRFNRVFGYAIEVTKANLTMVPDDYVRKQTLAGAERFVTTELKEQERRLLGAEERLHQLEAELFSALVAEVGSHHRELGANARALGLLDAVSGLAEVAHDQGYVRPRLDEESRIVIRAGRHPVVEAMLTSERFVPNDCTLDDEQQLLLITGPNMAGKSTYLRQVALIVLMAQMGSFVPAAEAQIGIVDRIFTRVGAADNLVAGDSTFMVEMRETAHILRELTDRSLVLLDEIGRGTSTFDGIAIAWAVAEHLHDHGAGAKTLFATHFYELTAMARQKERCRNYSVAVREWQDEIVFLRQIVAGPASRSYGVEVARLAGLPATVLERARALLATLERGELAAAERQVAESGGVAQQLGLFGARRSVVEQRLAELEVTKMTPLDALNELHTLVEVVRGRAHGEDDTQG